MQIQTGATYRIQEHALSAYSRKEADAASATPALHRLITLQPKGWVIVASDDAATLVLGYGTSPIDPRHLPPEFVRWMTQVDHAIRTKIDTAHAPKEHRLSSASPHPSSWTRLKKPPSSFVSHTPHALSAAYPYRIQPLLWLGGTEETGIRWSQGEYYNAQCPVDGKSLEGGHALTGCVATAMGQVLRYYRKPIVGSGTYGYSNSVANHYQHDYGYQFADFGSTAYAWDVMPTQLTDASTPAEREAVSTLLYHLGVSVGMDYGYGIGSDGSQDGGSLALYTDPEGGPAADTALKNYFGFTTVWARAFDYRYSEWKQKIITSLRNGNPVLYGGSSSFSGGHAFVLDGYAMGGRDAYFHFNWGWNGEANGQFTLMAITPEGNNFSDEQQALFFVPETHTADDGYADTIGGGCSYNPHNPDIDLLMLLMVLATGLYPWFRTVRRPRMR